MRQLGRQQERSLDEFMNVDCFRTVASVGGMSILTQHDDGEQDAEASAGVHENHGVLVDEASNNERRRHSTGARENRRDGHHFVRQRHELDLKGTK